jgi:hypothetical protein
VILERTLQENYLTAYAARKVSESALRVADKMDVSETTLRGWLREASFREAMRDADLGRAAFARDVAMRHIEAVVENVVSLAMGKRRASMRAAEIVLKIADMWPQAQQTNIVNVNTGPRYAQTDLGMAQRDLAMLDALLNTGEDDASGER